MARSNNFQVRVTGDTTKFDAAMQKAQSELQSFAKASKSAFAVVGVTSFAAAFAGLARTIGDFERANSELAAVLGTNLKGIEALTKSAKDLGRTSEFTASGVTKLQIALSRLGFTETQILQMQSSVLNFALAMGTDLSSAADFAGASLRAFGLEAKDTENLLDVMSAATTNSALDFTKLQASISVVAPIAKSFGLDVQETAAFLGVLSNNGFDASSAATALRNILLNLSDANGKLSKGIGHSAKSFDEIIEAFKELQAKGVDVGAVLEMTDKRSAAAAVTLISQADAAMTLKAKLDDSQGSLKTMADTMSDNLVGSTRALKSAWEGFQLALEGSKGPMKDVVDGLTDILNRITDIISKKDEVSWWEAFLGPITGGLIAARKRKNAGDPLGGGAGAAGSAEGGGGARGSAAEDSSSQVLTNTQKLERVEAAIEAWEKKRSNNQVKIAQLTAQIAEQQQKARDAFERGDTDAGYEAIAKARDLIDEKANLELEIENKLTDLLKQKAALKGQELKDVQAANQQAVKALNVEKARTDQLKTLLGMYKVEAIKTPENLLPKLNTKIDIAPRQVEEFKSKLQASLGDVTIYVAVEADTKKLHDISNEVNSMLTDLASTTSQILGELAADLINGEDPWKNFANSALSAFGDMAIAVGKMAIEMGIASEGIKAALHLDNPWVAISAGMALVALGTAVKTGLANVSNGNYSSSMGSYSSTSSSMVSDYEGREVTVNVTGTLQADGDQLVAVINNSNKKSYYTT